MDARRGHGGRATGWSAALLAALALAGCSQPRAEGPQTPPMGTAFVQTPPEQPFPEAPLTEENRAQLGAVVTGFLIDAQLRYAEGMTEAPEAPDVIVPLTPGTDHRSEVTLQAGRPYRFVGACDFECSNVDLELLDAQGQVVARDLMLNDTPVMDFRPVAAGGYTLRILMQTCTVTPCYAGVRTLTVR